MAQKHFRSVLSRPQITCQIATEKTSLEIEPELKLRLLPVEHWKAEGGERGAQGKTRKADRS
ncbi:hypothetical protein J6590_101919 [Homalodisca vitripennis]|nr:hypothetical protein J6590_101919 [Homalodisca vitripennis]